MCKVYSDVRGLTLPYIEPYYVAYAAEYVDTARPYADAFHEKVYTPGSAFAISSYKRYGEPSIAQLSSYGHKEWTRVVKPRLDQAHIGARSQYDKFLAPHINRASDVVDPYLTKAQVIAAQQYQQVILPNYRIAQPYAQAAYGKSYDVATGVILPYGRWAGETVIVFLQRRVWPPIRVAYGENVQPQLLKIRERLANYRDGKKIEAAVDEVDR